MSTNYDQKDRAIVEMVNHSVSLSHGKYWLYELYNASVAPPPRFLFHVDGEGGREKRRSTVNQTVKYAFDARIILCTRAIYNAHIAVYYREGRILTKIFKKLI